MISLNSVTELRVGDSGDYEIWATGMTAACDNAGIFFSGGWQAMAWVYLLFSSFIFVRYGIRILKLYTKVFVYMIFALLCNIMVLMTMQMMWWKDGTTKGYSNIETP